MKERNNLECRNTIEGRSAYDNIIAVDSLNNCLTSIPFSPDNKDMKRSRGFNLISLDQIITIEHSDRDLWLK